MSESEVLVLLAAMIALYIPWMEQVTFLFAFLGAAGAALLLAEGREMRFFPRFARCYNGD